MSSRKAEDVQEEHMILYSILTNWLRKKRAIYAEPE